jgi:hypothetical protein
MLEQQCFNQQHRLIILCLSQFIQMKRMCPVNMLHVTYMFETFVTTEEYVRNILIINVTQHVTCTF